jgi:hypothetical protein
MTALQMNQDFNGSVALIGKNVTYQAADHSQVTGTVSAVTASKDGAILTVDGKQVNSGDVVKVQ